ncbi:hypothetical protein JCM11251_003654 [Rhodosporidiobolus azoricus]
MLSFLWNLVFGPAENEPVSNGGTWLEELQLSSANSPSPAWSADFYASILSRPMRSSPLLSAFPPFPEDALDSLPTPEEVSQHGTLLDRADQSSLEKSVWKVTWHGIDMVVKRGRDVHLEEAAWTEMVRKATDLPVPKIYGTRVNGQETLIYLEMLPGTTLYKAVRSLPPTEYSVIRKQLDFLFQELHSLHAPEGAPLGGFGGQNLGALWPIRSHPLFTPSLPSFSTPAELHEWLRALNASRRELPAETWDRDIAPFLAAFSRPVLVHGDLNPSNILVDGDKVTGIIDWEMAGYYPEWIDVLRVVRWIRLSGGRLDYRLIGEGLWGPTREAMCMYERLWAVGHLFLGQRRDAPVLSS